MTKPSDFAVNIEVVKTGISQDKNGYYLRLALNPADDIAQLVTSPVGTRYACAFVEVSDHDEPVDKRDMEAVRTAAMLCRNTDFQAWLMDKGRSLEETEDGAAAAVHAICGIKSRAELATNLQAAAKWRKLRQEFLDVLRL